jgi:hypothetical protein
MPLDQTKSRQLLKQFDFRNLFLQELGWDNHKAALHITVDGEQQQLAAIAQKRGMVAYQCATPAGGSLPEYGVRRKIEQQVAKAAHEHLIIFTDAAQTIQIWQWVKREPGKPAACREHHFDKSQSGEALLQKLESIAFTLDEEETLVLTDVTRGVRAGFDLEQVTKKFFEQFKKEHTVFLGFIKGITEVADHEWYASVMLNRLMFVYFIQRKGFLDGDPKYLRNRLDRCKKEQGKDKFYTFYRYFLLRLFREGFGKRRKDRAPDLEKLLGNIPYLNGGLFDVHELEKPERYGQDIQIEDNAFERIFNFFDGWQWHLDERPLRKGDEINPDVLGYIFEKYINQKQMGAYYTKEDITEYISKNTVLPFLFDAARAKCKVAFENPNGPTVWDLLRENPDRYIYESVKKGVAIPLPKLIDAGIKDMSKRGGWNKLAEEEYRLPTETWREVVARRQRYEEVRKKLADGEVREVNDFITLNLDLRQFAQDVIQNCEDPDLLRAFWKSITTITVLDPTGGSGAFIFAALNILEPLYEACLDRMEVFVADLDRSGEKHRPEKFSDFREVLNEIEQHLPPTATQERRQQRRKYFIYKRSILNNLYAVDIMEEAVEICKLRLFLKLAAQVEPDTSRDNLGIEPLPDIDFNIRAGNTLVGYTTTDEVKKCMMSERTTGKDQMKLLVMGEKDAYEAFEDKLKIADAAFRSFRQQQTEFGGVITAQDKADLKAKLKALEDELNRYLAGEYRVKADADSIRNPKSPFNNWLRSHKPFHWFIQFYGILNGGGFDVIIGNPPYVAAAKARKSYAVKNLATDDCTDIYAWVLERSQNLLRTNGRTGMIVPLSLGFSGDFDSCRRLLFTGYSHNWFSSFGRIPAALFNFDVRVRNKIHLALKSKRPAQVYTTRLHRWFEAARPALFQSLEYAPFQPALWKYRIPKLNTAALVLAFEKMLGASSRTLDFVISPRATKHVLHFKKTAYNWLNFCREMPPCYEGSRRVSHTQFDAVYFPDPETRDIAGLAFNGKLLMIFWFAVGDDFHVTRWNFSDFPTDFSTLSEQQRTKLLAIAPKLEQAMEAAVQFKLNAGRRVGNFNLAKCRNVTDQSDLILAEALGFADVWEDIELYYAQTMKTDFSDDEDQN